MGYIYDYAYKIFTRVTRTSVFVFAKNFSNTSLMNLNIILYYRLKSIYHFR